jgi:hypothetical protein
MSLLVPKDSDGRDHIEFPVEQLPFADLLPDTKHTKGQVLILMTIIASGAW